MNNDRSSAGPSYLAYQVTNLGNGKKAAWTRIGAAFAHRDGEGFDVKLDALPVDGRVVLRRRDDKSRPSGK